MKKIMLLFTMLYLAIGNSQNTFDLGIHFQPNLSFRYWENDKLTQLPELTGQIYGGFGVVSKIHFTQKLHLAAEVDVLQRRFKWESNAEIQEFKSNNIDLSVMAGLDITKFFSLQGGAFVSRKFDKDQVRLIDINTWENLDLLDLKSGYGLVGQATITLDRLYISPRVCYTIPSLLDIQFTDSNGTVIGNGEMKEIFVGINVGVWVF